MKQVSAAIIFQNNKVLITRRGPNEKLAGMWEFPGGKREPNEDIFMCTERELREELNINCKASEILIKSFYKYDHGSFELIGVLTEIISGEITLNVHDNFIWVAVNNLLDYNLLPADIPIAKFLKHNFNNSEFISPKTNKTVSL